MLRIPDIRQVDDYDCGAAALLAVSSYHGRPVRSSLANAVQGLSPDTIEAELRAAGYAVLSGSLTVPDLEHYTGTGRPVLCCVQGSAGGHWVVVRGVAGGWVYYHDPTFGRRRVGAREWLRRWQDGTRAGAVYLRWGVVPYLPNW